MTRDNSTAVLLIGPYPVNGRIPIAGGQATACASLLDYVQRRGWRPLIVNTSRETAHGPLRRVLAGLDRLGKTLIALRQRPSAAIIFSSAGAGFYERSIQAFFCRLARVPALLFIRSGHFLDDVRNSRLQRSIARLLLRAPAVLGAQGTQWTQVFLSLGISSERIALVRNWLPRGATLAAAPRAHSGHAIVFTFVGSLVPKKGLSELIEAVEGSSLLRACHIRLIGEGPLSELLHAKIVRLGLSNITLHGALPYKNVLETLASSDVFVLPSHAEGFPNALLEAMAIGLPAIATNVGAIPDSLEDGVSGRIVPPKNVDALRMAMEEFAKFPERIPSMSVAALRAVHERHNFETNCTRMFEAVGLAETKH